MSSATRPGEGATTDADPTYVGVDFGVNNLLVAAPATADPEVADALVLEGTVECSLFEELGAITRRLEATPGDTRDREVAVFEAYRRAFVARFQQRTAELGTYLARFDRPVLALEDVSNKFRPLVDVRHGEVDPGTWLLPATHRALAVWAREAGIPTVDVAPDYTTQLCHVCGQVGEPVRDRLRCPDPGCPVLETCRDRSAAATIAHHAANQEGADGRR